MFKIYILNLSYLLKTTKIFRDESLENNRKNSTAVKLNGAISRYASACASFKAAGTPQRSLQFACDYSKLRSEFLQALVQLLHSCRTLCTAPPYAIAIHEAVSAKDELLRYGRVTPQVSGSGSGGAWGCVPPPSTPKLIKSYEPFLFRRAECSLILKLRKVITFT